jgi:S-adenosylmethionine synthetase
MVIELGQNLFINEYAGRPVSEQPVEIVERKGLGHPDSICDAVAEEASIALSKEYMVDLIRCCIIIWIKVC